MGIVKDSFNVSLNNPQKIEVTWYIYQGDALLAKGSGSSMEYKSVIIDRSRTYYIELLYSFGGQDSTEDILCGRHALGITDSSRESLSKSISRSTYQKLKIRKVVPFQNVDLTAFARTAKLGYYPPSLPYFGRASTSRGEGADFNKVM